MNIELLRQVQEKIREHPEHFSMRSWASGAAWASLPLTESNFLSFCNTEACISGWAVILSERLANEKITLCRLSEDIRNEGADVLGLKPDEAERLFYDEEWPVDFEARYGVALANRNWPLAAQVACERIEHFIATEGRE